MMSPGAKIGNIRLIEELDKGGMGQVYVGIDEKLKRRVAVKSLRRDRSLDPAVEARFLREARILSRLDHDDRL